MRGKSVIKHREGKQQIKKALVGLTVSMLAGLPVTAIAAGQVPGAGSILKQVQPNQTPEPSKSETPLNLERPANSKMVNTKPFLVKHIRIVGNRAFSTKQLHALVAQGEGKRLTLSKLNELAQLITAYYQQHDYPLARAIIPPQTIKNGVVKIQVIEAKYGSVALKNQSAVESGLLAQTLAPLKSGEPISESKLDRSLLLMTDIPGVNVSAKLKPGAKVETSDLTVDASKSGNVAGAVFVNNYGGRYTGRNRFGGVMHILNPFRHGDVLSLTGMSSGPGLTYGRMKYDTLLDGNGTRAGADYSALHYKLGNDLSSVDGFGTAADGSAWVKRPLIRTRQYNLYAQVKFDHKILKDNVGVSNVRTDRHLDEWHVKLNGDWRDNLLLGGVSTWRLRATAGHLGFDNASAYQADASSAQTAGRFLMWNLAFSRLQHLGDGNALYFQLYGQYANTNLDSAEQLTLGGPYSIPAYEVGALSGDSGYQERIEFRHDLSLGIPGALQAKVFLESGHLRLHQDPWTQGQDSATLSGTGIGLSWVGLDGFAIDATVSRSIGGVPSMLGHGHTVRLWAQLAKSF